MTSETPAPSLPVVAEYTYNGLGQRTGWHYDVNASGTVDSGDPWFHFFYDERWRMVATVRSSSGTLDTSPKELFVNHQAGLGGYGGSSYIDTVTIIDRDMTNGWGGAADGTLEQRSYPLQNWRADVVAVSNTGGMLVEGSRYSAYGVRTQFLPADFNSNGAITIDDLFLYQNAYFANDPSADFNFSGGVTIDDLFLYNNAYFTGGAVGRNALSTLGVRKGFAGYENDGVLVRFSHVRNRVYDNVLARWTRRDPVGYVDGMSLYQYVKDMPIAKRDPLGLVCVGCFVPACPTGISGFPSTSQPIMASSIWDYIPFISTIRNYLNDPTGVLFTDYAGCAVSTASCASLGATAANASCASCISAMFMSNVVSYAVSSGLMSVAELVVGFGTLLIDWETIIGAVISAALMLDGIVNAAIIIDKVNQMKNAAVSATARYCVCGTTSTPIPGGGPPPGAPPPGGGSASGTSFVSGMRRMPMGLRNKVDF